MLCNQMLIAVIIGTRPQLIKVSPVLKEIGKFYKRILINTGQHYDYELNEIFFENLNIPKPDYNLAVGSGTYGQQTGKMIMEIEKVLLIEKPDFVLIFGDTNSTLAGAIATTKLNIPLGHIEAGCRNFDMNIPEEINRIVADKVSDYLFAPTQIAWDNLNKEGIIEKVYLTGDVMYDTFCQNIEVADESDILNRLGLSKKGYLLVILHRHDCEADKVFEVLNRTGHKTVVSLHPGTRKKINIQGFENLIILKPQGYLDFLKLMKNAKKIITDSGGMQKEAYWLKVPCLTVFDSTSWPETVTDGWNQLVKPEEIYKAINDFNPTSKQYKHWGDGKAAEKIVNFIDHHKYSKFFKK